eukprot:c43525_g1_i1 orf=237-1049(-)
MESLGWRSCCLNHAFADVACKNLDRVAIVHASSFSHSVGSDCVEEGLGYEGRPIYHGDVAYTYSELLGAVDELAKRLLAFRRGSQTPSTGEIMGGHSKHNLDENAGLLYDNTCLEKIWIGVEEQCECKRIGVLLGPSADYIISLLAVLKVGAAFVPLDPLWPMGRILAVVADSKPCLVITCKYMIGFSFGKSYTLENLTSIMNAPVLCLPDGFAKEWKVSCQADVPINSCNTRKTYSYCYVMYTSGSTGNPKGVCGREEGMQKYCQGTVL